MRRALYLSLAMLSGCQMQTPVQMNSNTAQDVVNNLRYVKDKHNQCFAVVASRHNVDITTNGFSITWVPCSPEVEAAINER